MIQLNSTVQNILMQPLVEAFYLVNIADTYKTTSFFDDITLSNGEEYAADGYLLSVDPPRLSTTVDKEAFKLVLADPEFLTGPFVDQGLVGQSAHIRLGFINQTTKQPELHVDNTLTIYKGRVDAVAYGANLKGVGDVGLSIICASPMSNLDLRKQFFTSKEFVRNLSSDDSSCDQVFVGSGTIQLKWGKT